MDTASSERLTVVPGFDANTVVVERLRLSAADTALLRLAEQPVHADPLDVSPPVANPGRVQVR